MPRKGRNKDVMGDEKYWSGTLTMDPGHHTAFLLAILICILLLLLAASALLMCYLRRNGFTISSRKSMKLGATMRDQSTSMTSFAWNLMDSKLPIYNNPQAIPFTVDIHKITSSLSLDSHILCISDEDEGTLASSVGSKSVKKSDSSGQYSALKYMLSSGASLLGSVWEKSSMFSLRAKRRSSSLKSGVDVDVLMVPLESPVHVSSSKAFQATSVPTNLSRSSTLLCEDSCDQQFTWNTAGLSTQSEHITQKDAGFVPSALEKEPSNTEEEKSVTKDMAQVPYPDFLEPKSWFVPIGNRPVSDGAKLEKKELNNVASLDSGVDTTELLLRPGSGGLNTMPKVLSTQGSANYIPLSSTKANSRENMQEEEETREDGDKLYITHQEAARKLNSGYPGRSLWEKREERPLIGVN